ncbi:hypothetical protein D030_4790A, partial [Vibrio parahaemolyticus AQ3810]|jgi:hypothetical protein
MKLR